MNGAINFVSKLPTKDFLHPPPVDLPQYLSLLQSIFQSRSLRKGKQLHAHAISSGVSLNSHHGQKILSELTSLYAACGDTGSARQLFDGMTLKTTFLWNRVIKGYVEHGLSSDALRLFCLMGLAGDQRSDSHTFTFSLKACSDLGIRENVVGLHCRAIAEGFQLDGYVQNSLISSYMRCGDRESAGKVFDRMHSSTKTVVSWSAVISGLVENGRAKEALVVFDKMVQSGFIPGRSTVVSVLPACASTNDLRRGRSVHKMIVQNGYVGFLPARNSLIDMYTKCGRLGVARKLFDDDRYDRDVVSWTAMIAGYVATGCVEESLALTHNMMLSPWKPNAVTMTAILSACSIRHGKSIHGLCVRLHLDRELIVEASLLEMYGRCGSMSLSLNLFANCSQRPATWNPVISCYRRNGLALPAINHFKQMLHSGVRPNDTTIMSILPAYSDTDYDQAKSLHCYIIKTGFAVSTEAVTGLVNLYSKLGNLPTARDLFDGLPTEAKDVVVWSSIINGYGMHGHANTAIELFNRMVESGIEPNEITYTTILHSCSHAGLVDEGLILFNRMRSRSDTTCCSDDHYSCIIDLLGRANRLDEARKLILETTPSPAMWGALLGACAIHGNVELGEQAGRRLFELEPENTGNYVLLGNLYASSGRWNEAASVRRKLKQRGLRKQPGCSRNLS